MAKIPVMKKVQQIRSLASLWRHRAQLWSMGRDMAAGRYRATLLTIVALVLAAIYIISPVDFLPDFIPFIGLIDDGFVFYFLLKRLMVELERYGAATSRLKLIK